MPKRILVIDDDPHIRELVADLLRLEGYHVETAGDGESGLALAATLAPDLIVLDLMMPAMDGFEVTRRIRRHSQVPIVVLTVRDAELDKLQGFTLGVDDYVTKPFSPLELLMRVKAVLRRASPARAEEHAAEVVQFGDVTVDRLTHRVLKGGRLIPLTTGEFNVLWALVSHPGQVLTREQVMELAWGPDAVGGPESVTVLVSRIREKIEDDPASPRWIQTVRGAGYRFVPQPRSPA
ncbi:response regulator transcription factor [Caldinitratiruptor microaerophilus]|uniref:Stage 0 sporulation protein A homolog n=1 Tax=Caldinitratiruptor microaerophilus TaxID=671077 RepID=A0AA35CLD9_9FIRM|nr:response regulator transcription factor [Caldinitratiruptor microaerophilus]BDG60553.1 DNA-binding response regulator [Caldinitratiruptor microaerophilus]